MTIDLNKFKTVEDLPDDPEKLKAIMLSAFARLETLAQDVSVLENFQVLEPQTGKNSDAHKSRFSTNKKLLIDIDQQVG